MSDFVPTRQAKQPVSIRARRRRLRGQAMVEYSIVTHFILLGGTLTFLQVYVQFYDNLAKFYEGIYFVLNNAAI